MGFDLICGGGSVSLSSFDLFFVSLIGPTLLSSGPLSMRGREVRVLLLCGFGVRDEVEVCRGNELCRECVDFVRRL